MSTPLSLRTRVAPRSSVATRRSDPVSPPTRATTPGATPAAVFEGQVGGAAVLVAGSPAQLDAPARAAWMKQSLLQDHSALAARNPEGLKAKLEKLTTSPFVFFRGTAGLLYRELQGLDDDKPRLLINGDVHPENFGIVKGRDGELFFAPNDFDEATVAPFSWDLRRGAVGFLLAARELGLSRKERERLVERFVDAYAEALEDFGKGDAEAGFRITAKRAPTVLKRLFDDAEKLSRKAFLGRHVDVGGGVFRDGDELARDPGLVPALTRALSAARGRDGARLSASLRAAGLSPLKVKDVARKLGSGTASVGLDRFWLLVEGPRGDGSDDRVLELKSELCSIVDRVRPRSLAATRLAESAGARVARAHEVHLAEGDPLYGHTRFGGQSFLVRERIPEKARVELSSLKDDELIDYAAVCARALAAAHARADEDGGLEGRDVETRIRASFKKGAFAEELFSWASAAADRVEADHGSLVRMLEDGSFDA